MFKGETSIHLEFSWNFSFENRLQSILSLQKLMKADNTLTTPTTSSEDETFQRTSTRSGQFKPPLKRTSDTEIEVIKVVYPHIIHTALRLL